MAAYIISDVTIKEGAAIETYRQRAAASIAQHGGRYVVRGGEIEVLEGSWRPRAVIIAEFPGHGSRPCLVSLRRICFRASAARSGAQP